MKAVIRFFQTMLLLPKPWLVWVLILMIANMVIPLFYLETLEGRVVLAVMMAAAMTMIMIFSAKGFVRLLGLGHIYWVLLILWLADRVGFHPPENFFEGWLLAVILLNGLSLVIDFVDVLRYVRGEREPTLALDPSGQR
ncbi:MAG: hypothetical protein ACE5E9_14380 [Nitrospinaceae bacterium]